MTKQVSVRVKRVDPAATLPEYATPGSAGFDLRASLFSSMLLIQPGERVVVGTGLAFEVPDGYELQVRPRSGLSRDGIDAIIGTIDSDYRGEVKILLINNTKHTFQLRRNERIAQAVLSPAPRAELVEVDELTSTVRGNGGFGSTGRS